MSTRVGNREALLAGAKQCLYEKGYLRTTVRDIAAAAGVSMAAIGYHFGSKEALLNAALYEAIDEWGDAFAAENADLLPRTGEPLVHFEETWTRVIEAFAGHGRLWAATFEMFAQIEEVPVIQQQLVEFLNDGREGLAALFQGIDPEADPEQARLVGSFYYALLSGVLVQWLIDRESAPTGADLARALRFIMSRDEQDSTGPAPGPTRS